MNFILQNAILIETQFILTIVTTWYKKKLPITMQTLFKSEIVCT